MKVAGLIISYVVVLDVKEIQVLLNFSYLFLMN